LPTGQLVSECVEWNVETNRRKGSPDSVGHLHLRGTDVFQTERNVIADSRHHGLRQRILEQVSHVALAMM
jgi:hypothetical protein